MLCFCVDFEVYDVSEVLWSEFLGIALKFPFVRVFVVRISVSSCNYCRFQFYGLLSVAEAFFGICYCGGSCGVPFVWDFGNV